MKQIKRNHDTALHLTSQYNFREERRLFCIIWIGWDFFDTISKIIYFVLCYIYMKFSCCLHSLVL